MAFYQSMYHTTQPIMTQMDRDAVHLIGVVCCAPPGLSIEEIRKNFSLKAYWNQHISEEKSQLCEYITLYTKELLAFMMYFGMLKCVKM